MKKLLLVLVGILLVNFLLLSLKPKVPGVESVSGKTHSLMMSEVFEDDAQNAKPVSAQAWVIVPESCRSCQTGAIVDQLKMLLPGLQVQYVGSQESQALMLTKLFQINMLPAYVFSKDVEKSQNFDQLVGMTTFVEDKYYLAPAFAGASYFLGRVKEPKKLDLFIQLTGNDTLAVLNRVKELTAVAPDIKVSLNFVGQHGSQGGRLIAAGGIPEINEDKLYVCVEKLYPQKTNEYLECRLNDKDRLWLDDCLSRTDIKKEDIKGCLESPEAEQLLEEKIKLSEELRVSYAPLFFLDNVEIFGINTQTTTDELLSVIDPTKTNPTPQKRTEPVPTP